MKFLIFIVVILLLSFLTVSAQETNVKMQFGVYDTNGNFFNGLKSSDIKVKNEKADFKINSFELKTDKPLEIVIMIDASASQERMLPDEKKAAEIFIDTVLNKEKDKVAVVKFTGDVALVQDLTSDFAKAKQSLSLIEFEPPAGYVGGGIVAGKNPPDQLLKGSTSIYDSVNKVLGAFSKIENKESQKAIVLISDGVNTYGDTKLKESVNFSLKTKTPIYAIGIADEFYGKADKKSLEKLTEPTGGMFIIPKKKLADFPTQIEKFKVNLHSGYEFTFTINKSDSEKNKIQEIEIEIINPDLRKQKLRILQPKGFSLN